MNNNANTPPAPATVTAPAQPAPASASSQPGAEVTAEHDTTLKWIVPEDHADGPARTPPPVVEPRRERTPPALPPPPKRTTTPPVGAAGRADAAASAKREPASPAEPPRETAAGPASTPPPSVRPAQVATQRPHAVSTPPADAGGAKGATPTEFVLPDSLPSAAIATPPAEVIGAAPVAVLPGPMGSDSELSADAVELLPSAADEVGSAAARPTPAPDDTPRDGINVQVAPSKPAPPAPTEPREVEPEAVEILESAEHQAAPAPVPPAAKTRTLTPPPVRPELASLTPPPVPPEIAAAHATPAQRPAAIAAALFEEFQTPSLAGEPVPEALARRSLQKRSKPWFEEVFDEDYLRTLPFMTPDQTAREASFIRDALSPPKGGEVLDLACGYGRHALELTQQGLHLTGLDLSLPLLIRAADDAQRRGLAVNFVHADMREMTFNSQFDAAYCVLSSFGYFDEETNLRVASAACRALKPGGRFLLDIINRDYIVGDVPSRVWWEGDGCVVLEEVDFNYHTSRVLIRRSVVFGNGRQSEQEISMRAYSLHEVGKLLRQAGFRVLQVSGGIATKSRFFGAASRNIIAVCERPAT